MTDDRDHALLERFWTLHAALLRRDGLELRWRHRTPVDQLGERTLSAADGVLRARAELFRYLIDSGWTPPAHVLDDLARDTALLDTCVDAFVI